MNRRRFLALVCGSLFSRALPRLAVPTMLEDIALLNSRLPRLMDRPIGWKSTDSIMMSGALKTALDTWAKLRNGCQVAPMRSGPEAQ